MVQDKKKEKSESINQSMDTSRKDIYALGMLIAWIQDM
jgi:NAD(P)H-nitrite reductase large subunit